MDQKKKKKIYVKEKASSSSAPKPSKNRKILTSEGKCRPFKKIIATGHILFDYFSSSETEDSSIRVEPSDFPFVQKYFLYRSYFRDGY